MPPTVLGIDLGGTKIDVALVETETWSVLRKERIDTNASQGFNHVLSEMLAVIQSIRRPDTKAIGVGVPGLVRQPDGIILRLPNIPGAEDSALQKHLATETGLPCRIDNDANCFTLAEAVSGAGRGHSIVVGVTMGTGVGGGIVINETIFRGEHGFAAEFGHMLLVPGKPPFQTNDIRGDAEQFFSGTAMGKRCPQASDPREYLVGTTCSFMHEDIDREVAWMCASLTHVLDPGIIVFGGSAGDALSTHLPAIRKELSRWVLPGTPLPKLVSSECAEASVLGAAQLTRSLS